MVDNIFDISSAVIAGASGVVNALFNGVWALFNAITDIF